MSSSQEPPRLVRLDGDALSHTSSSDDLVHAKKQGKSAQKEDITSTGNSSSLSSSRQQKIDNFLGAYCKWSASSTLTERGIKMAQYTVWLFSRLTQDKHKVFSTSLRKVYSDLSMMRYVLRLYGMPEAIAGVRAGGWSGGNWKDKRIHTLGKVMAYSMVIYHPLEHIAWAQWTMPKLISKRRVDGNKFSAWSCRFWLCFIVADLISSVLKNKELEERKRLLANETVPSGRTDSITTEQQTIDKAIYMNKLQIVRNIFFTPPCMSWSGDEWATNPLLSENWINGLSFAEALTCMHQSICSLNN